MTVALSRLALLAVFCLSLPAMPAFAEEAREDRIARLEAELKKLQDVNVENSRRQQILTEEVRKLREQLTVPETPEMKAMYGMGPAASKVYGIQKGLSIGGYGQAWYSALTGKKGDAFNQADLARAVMYTGYKFNDKLVINTELEVEHATTEHDGTVSVEFAQLDYLDHPKLNWRAGLLLLPIGFINTIHEPLFYHGNMRPFVEQVVIPATWAEMGAGIFGKLDDEWDYRAYIVNSLRAAKFSGDGFGDAEQAGGRARAEDFSLALRTDYQVTPEMSVGGSLFAGDQGQHEALVLDKAGNTATPQAAFRLYEAHAEYRKSGLHLRALAVRTDLEDAGVLSAAAALRGAGPIGGRMEGAYGEAAYELMPHLNARSKQSLAFFARREYYNTLEQVPFGFAGDPTKEVRLTTFGFDYKPDPQFVIKIDYSVFDPEAGTVPNALNFGIGWIF